MDILRIFLDVLLVLCGIVGMAAWIQWRKPNVVADEWADAYEAGWDVGFASALELIRKHAQREPVSIEYLDALHDRGTL